MTAGEAHPGVLAPRLRPGDATPGRTSPVYREGPLTRTDIVRYAGAGGDFNPVHHDEALAHGLGLPSVFAMGLLGTGFLSRLVVNWLGLANLRYLAVRYRAQVWPGDELVMEGTVVRAYQQDDEDRVDVELTVRNGDGKQVISGRATARLDQAGQP